MGIASFIANIAYPFFNTESVFFQTYLDGVFCKNTEAIPKTCPVKKMFLEILQNSEENTGARVSFFMKLQVSGIWK